MKTSSTKTTKSNLKEVFALWEAKKGDKVYYTGKTSDDKPIRLVAFINEVKKNPNQPDIPDEEISNWFKEDEKANQYDSPVLSFKVIILPFGVTTPITSGSANSCGISSSPQPL